MSEFTKSLEQQTLLGKYRRTGNIRYYYAFICSLLSLIALVIAVVFALYNFDITDGVFRERALYIVLGAGIARAASLILSYRYAVAFYSLVALLPILLLLYVSAG